MSDICHLEHSWIHNRVIDFERTKYPNRARVIISEKAESLIEKYRPQAWMNYVFPVFKKRETSPATRINRVRWINRGVNEVLRKICSELGITQKR